MVKPNAIPDPGEPAPLGDGFLFFGRLSPEKGLDLLLDAWRRHPDGTLGPLRIAGDGELRPLAEAAAAGTSRRRVPRPAGPGRRGGGGPGHRGGGGRPTWHDVLPTVVIEALAAGRPVLGTALGGVPYLIGMDHPAGAAGWVVPPDPAALAAALPTARVGAAALAPLARARYLSTFHPDVVTTQLLDIYKSLTPYPLAQPPSI